MPADEFDTNEVADEITTDDIPAVTEEDLDAEAEDATREILGEDEQYEDQQEEAPALPPAAALSQPPPAAFPMDQFAEVMRNTIQPLLPKPAVEKMWWDDPKQMQAKMLSNPENFHKSFHEAVDHKVKQALAPVLQKMEQQGQMMGYVYSRSAEREGFSDIAKEADQIAKDYGVPYQTAMRMATDRASKAKPPAPSRPKVRTPGKHASGPASSRETGGDARPTNDSKGPTDFGSIMKEVRRDAKGKFK